jgi:hypothetical protein
MDHVTEERFISFEFRQWTVEDDRELRTLAISGSSIAEIAARLDRPRRDIMDRFGKLGL